jgi:hypothetical protein
MAIPAIAPPDRLVADEAGGMLAVLDEDAVGCALAPVARPPVADGVVAVVVTGADDDGSLEGEGVSLASAAPGEYVVASAATEVTLTTIAPKP